MEESLWMNEHINDVEAAELRFELGGYIGKLSSTGYYIFDSTVERDHYVDALAYAWQSVAAGAVDAYGVVRKRKR
jgi:hypothetical protein